MIPADWIEHRRPGDGERLGWITENDDGFDAIDLLGRVIATRVDWVAVERALEDAGIGYLAAPYELEAAPGEWVPVRLVEVSPDGIRLKGEDYGDMTADVPSYAVGFPLPVTVRERNRR